jgi:hypothetical protein
MRRMIAVVCSAGLVLAGCDGPAPSPNGSPSTGGASPTARRSLDTSHTRQIVERLGQAVRKLTSTSFRFDGGSGIAQVTGSFDAAHKVGMINGSLGIGAVKALAIGPDLYVNGVAKDRNVWVHVDTDKLAPGNVLTQVTDPTISTGYLNAVSSASQPRPNEYEGTIDVARLGKAAAGSDRNAKALLQLLGANPADVTFDATVDGAGRLTELSITVPEPEGSASTTVTTRYYGFGTRVDVRRPAADEVQEAPRQLYTVLAPTPQVSGSPQRGATP